MIAVISVTVLFFVLGGSGVLASENHDKSDLHTVGEFPNYVDLFKKTQSSVVQITRTVSFSSSMTIINGMPYYGYSTMLGSGFVYDPEGRIVTNAHVVGQNKVVYVTFTDGNVYTAKVIGKDPYNDLAVIQLIDNFTGEKLIPLQLGNSSLLEVGQYVAAVGNPFGLQDTMSHGIVSQLGRSLHEEGTGGFSIPDVIQTNAPINPGNSGGPLLNLEGYVVGVNSAINSNTGNFAGVGFAIPSNQVARIVPSLIKNGTYQHPWLGIGGRDVTPDISNAYGLEKNFKGVVIENVVPGSAAAKAGIEAATDDKKGIPHGGDIIISVDGHYVKSITDLISYQDDHKSVGDKMELGIERDDKIIEVTVTLLARPPPLITSNEKIPASPYVTPFP